MKKKSKLFFLITLITIVLFSLIFLYYKNISYDRDNEHDINIEKLEKVDSIVKNPMDIPKNVSKNIYLETTELISKINENEKYVYWTFNNTVPGPLLRVKEGEIVNLTIHNINTSKFHHSIDLHAVTGYAGGGEITQVAPGETKSFSFNASKPGLYVYHCATPHVAHHMTNGMYGMILVEPKDGMKVVDKEFYIMQGEFYMKKIQNEKGIYTLDDKKMISENPDYIVFNGAFGGLTNDFPIEVSENETIRLYVGNGGVSKISSFHIIGEIFDKVYQEGNTNLYIENVQTTLIPVGGSVVIELNMSKKGSYPFVDHALARLDKGAFGTIKVK